MGTQSWADDYVEQVNNGNKFKFYRDQGLDVSNLSQVNEWLVRDGFKPLDEARHQALINARESY
jgi:hypothetical protein